MKNYTNIPDEELITIIKENIDSKATSELFDRYKEVIKHKCRVFLNSNIEYDDLLQEGMIGLYKAIQNYDAKSNVPFNFFSKICINHQILSALKSSNRKKNEILNEAISLNSVSSSNSSIPLLNMFPSSSRNPESIIIDTEKYDIIKSELSPLENQIFLLFLDGYSYFDIAKELDIEKKAVDNALQRIKKKISIVYQKNNLK